LLVAFYSPKNREYGGAAEIVKWPGEISGEKLSPPERRGCPTVGVGPAVGKRQSAIENEGGGRAMANDAGDP
jgi:hypothetical protein